jgi:hypothetical protein
MASQKSLSHSSAIARAAPPRGDLWPVAAADRRRRLRRWLSEPADDRRSLEPLKVSASDGARDSEDAVDELATEAWLERLRERRSADTMEAARGGLSRR